MLDSLADTDGGLLAAVLDEFALQVCGRCQVVGVDMGFEYADDGQSTLLHECEERSAVSVLIWLVDVSKSSTGSMMTACLVAGSTTMYCHVPDFASKHVCISGSKDILVGKGACRVVDSQTPLRALGTWMMVMKVDGQAR